MKNQDEINKIVLKIAREAWKSGKLGFDWDLSVKKKTSLMFIRLMNKLRERAERESGCEDCYGVGALLDTDDQYPCPNCVEGMKK